MPLQASEWEPLLLRLAHEFEPKLSEDGLLTFTVFPLTFLL